MLTPFTPRSLLALTTLAVAPLAAVPALADPESWEVTCTSSTPVSDGGMICNEGKMLKVSAPNPGQKMLLRIGAPTTHCSDITYVINRFPGSSTPIATTRRLAPGEDQIIELAEGWAEEGTYITISAIGHVGGCNVGHSHGWAVEVSAAPVP
ncbi:hypothetical protein [Rhodobacter calidifons]|uniref:Secreted protein n=1 Tax=Rhodobacter calidifons TaxID=2715277 RepID=A0ABX0G327_9RHOB|nr:hypothetical protein [Rhodobacter calidifons]NHB75330.1 hypothetical protein [Rhodobacter calidifons]